jgi:hypothetical protein
VTTVIAPYEARYFASCCDMNMWTTLSGCTKPGRPPELLPGGWTCLVCKKNHPLRLVEYGTNLAEIDDSDDDIEEEPDVT